MLMKYLSEYQPSRMRSMSSLNTEAGRRRRSKMVMPTWIIARGERTAGLVSCRPYGLLEGPSGYPGDRLPSVLLASLLATTAGAVPPLAAAEPDPAALLDRLDAAWKSHDEAAWLGAWRTKNEEERAEERDYVRERWAGEESRLEIERPVETPRPPFKVPATVISIAEPRGRVEQVVFTLERGPDGWAVTGRQ